MEHGIISTRRWIFWTAVVVVGLGGVGAATFARGRPAPAQKAISGDSSGEQAAMGPSPATPDAVAPKMAANTTNRGVEGPRVRGNLKKARLGGPEGRLTVKKPDAPAPQIGANVQEAHVPPVGAEPVSARYPKPAPAVEEPDVAPGEPVIIAQAPPGGAGGDPAQIPLQTALETAKALFNQGCEMNAPYMLSSGKEYAKGRGQFIVPMLKALKVLLDNGVPPEDAQPELPAVSGLSVPRIGVRTYPDGRVEVITVDPALLKPYEEQMEARKKAMLLLDAWIWRRLVTGSIAARYARLPYATEELRQLATGILKDDAVVNVLVQKAEAGIAWNTVTKPPTPGEP